MPRERWYLGGIVDGPFADAKGAVEESSPRWKIEPWFERAQVLPLSPVGATVQSGWVSQHALGTIDGTWSAFELDLADLFVEVPERILYRDVITYPPLREDLAFVAAKGAPAYDLMRAAREAAGEELREVRFLSDLSRSADPEAGSKSLALVGSPSPVARADTPDEDAVRLRTAIVERLADEFDAQLRTRPSARFARVATECEMLSHAERHHDASEVRASARWSRASSSGNASGTQLELIEALAAAGCHVTCAMVSRDVRELGILEDAATRSAAPATRCRSRAGRVDPRESLDTLPAQFNRKRRRGAEPAWSSSARSARRRPSPKRSTGWPIRWS